MNKIGKILIIGIFLVFITSNISLGFQIEKQKDNNLIFSLEFDFPEPIVIDDIVDSVKMGDLPVQYDLNLPCLPVKPVRILLPAGTVYEDIFVETSTKVNIGYDFDLKTGSRVIPLIEGIDSDLYLQENKVSDDYEYSKFSVVGVYSCRGFSILHVNLYPVLYNPLDGEISYFDSMKVIVKTKNAEEKTAFRGTVDDFDLVESLVDNPEFVTSYGDVNYNTFMEDYEYVIITSEEFKDSQVENNLQDLVDSKVSRGISAGIFTVEDIVSDPDYSVSGVWGDDNPSNPFYQSEITGSVNIFDDTPARIRNFIRHAYSEWGTNYVLLAGDADVVVPEDNIIPLRGLFANESGLPLEGMILAEEEDDIPSDVYYACLDGNFNYDCDVHFGECASRNSAASIDEADLYSEVWVGRACIDSEYELSNFVRKTLSYQENGDSYLSEILFVGEDLGFPGVSRWGGNYKDVLVDEGLVPSDYTLTRFYDRDYEYNSWSPQELVDQINNNNPHLINHDGHGNHFYIFKSHGNMLEGLTNENLFFLYSHSCLTGSFDNYNCWSGYKDYDCIAEYVTVELEHGAFACILNARYGLGSENSLESPSGAYDESFYEALFVEGIRQLGAASHYSKEDNIWRIDDNGLRWCFYQTNLFGDPELSIKNINLAPSMPTITGPAKGKPGVEYEYTIVSSDPEGQDVYYWVEWFDGCPGVNWIGPYSSGEQITVKNTWNEKGTFTVSVKARDEDGAVGPTGSLSVRMPLTRFSFERFSSFFDIFPLFKQFFL